MSVDILESACILLLTGSAAKLSNSFDQVKPTIKCHKPCHHQRYSIPKSDQIETRLILELEPIENRSSYRKPWKLGLN